MLVLNHGNYAKIACVVEALKPAYIMVVPKPLLIKGNFTLWPLCKALHNGQMRAATLSESVTAVESRKQSVILMNQMELPAKNGYSELLQNYLKRLNVKYKRFFSLVDSKRR
ncbi:MAG: hypothetical protein KGZ88_00735 [Methylomicrobium sp.]|jgi:hypothetical protein|nr:hypothetical protein [Methylomicrobium sp.]